MFGYSEFIMGAMNAMPVEKTEVKPLTKREKILGVIGAAVYFVMTAMPGLALISLVYLVIKIAFKIQGVDFP